MYIESYLYILIFCNLTFQKRSKHLLRFRTWFIRVFMIACSISSAFYLSCFNSLFYFRSSEIGEADKRLSIFSDFLSIQFLKKPVNLFCICFSRLYLMSSLRQNWISPLRSCLSNSSSSYVFHLSIFIYPESRRNLKVAAICLSQCSPIVCILLRAEKLIFIRARIRLYFTNTFRMT